MVVGGASLALATTVATLAVTSDTTAPVLLPQRPAASVSCSCFTTTAGGAGGVAAVAGVGGGGVGALDDRPSHRVTDDHHVAGGAAASSSCSCAGVGEEGACCGAA